MNKIHSNLLSPNTRDFSLEPGLVLRVDATVFCIVSIQDDVATLENTVSFDRKIVQIFRLLSDLVKGKVKLAEPDAIARALDGDIFSEDDQVVIRQLPLDELSDAQQKQVVRVTHYIRALRDKGYTSLNPKKSFIQLELDKLQKQFDDPKRPKASWVYKWSLALDRANGDSRAIIPRYDLRGGHGGSRLDPIVESAIQRVIESRKIDTTAKIRTQDILDQTKSILHIEQPNNLDLLFSLSWSTVDRRVKESFGAYDICVRNKGKAAAKKKFREWHPRDRAEFPLGVFEVDDKDMRVFLIDEKSGLPYGRAWITGVIDQCSDVMMGWEMSEQARSAWSAISSIVHAILPKDPAHPDFAECEHLSEFYGKPAIAVFDNALYNHAHEIGLHAEIIDFIVGWAKSNTPTEKSAIEGWNGRVERDFLPTLPGYRGDKRFKDGLAEGMASANMGLNGFQQLLTKWSVDVDANNPRRSDGLTPRQRWHYGMRYAKPRLPRDIYGLRLEATLHHTLKLRPEGINFYGIIYSSPILKLMKKRYGHNAEVTFRYTPKNLGEIFVFDPELKAYMPVLTANPEYAERLTLKQHKLIRKLARSNGIKNPSIPDFLRAREQLRIMTEQLRFSKKISERKRAKRTGDLPKALDQSQQSKTSDQETYVVTELEDQVIQLESVEMDDEDEGWVMPDNF